MLTELAAAHKQLNAANKRLEQVRAHGAKADARRALGWNLVLCAGLPACLYVPGPKVFAHGTVTDRPNASNRLLA